MRCVVLVSAGRNVLDSVPPTHTALPLTVVSASIPLALPARHNLFAHLNPYPAFIPFSLSLSLSLPLSLSSVFSGVCSSCNQAGTPTHTHTQTHVNIANRVLHFSTTEEGTSVSVHFEKNKSRIEKLLLRSFPILLLQTHTFSGLTHTHTHTHTHSANY